MTEEKNNLESEETVALSSEPQQENDSSNPEEVTTLQSDNGAPSEDAMPKMAENNFGEIPPAQTDLNQTPPGPNPFPTQDATNAGFTEKKDNAKNIKKPLIIVGCLVVVALLGYFVIYPMIANKFMSSPKNVFEATATKLTTNVNQTLEMVNIGSSAYDVDLKLDTNIPSLKAFSDVSYKIRAGMDSKNQKLEAKAAMIKKDNSEVGATVYVKDNYLFYQLTSDKKLVKAMDLSQEEDFKEIFENKETINSEELQYLVNKVRELMFKELKEEDFTKEDSTLTVNGSEVKATKNSLVIDKAKLTTIAKSMINGLYEDNKAMEIISKFGISKEDFKKELVDGADYDSIEDDFKFVYNLYTIKSDVIGMDFYDGDDKLFYYYSNEGNFEAVLMPTEEEDKIVVTGVKDGDKTNVSFKAGKEEIVTLKVSAFDDKQIKFDYVFNLDENQKMQGTVDIKQNDNVTDLDVSAKVGEEYIKVTSKVKIEANAKIADFDSSKAVTLSEEEMQQALTDFLKTTEGTPIDFLIQTLNEEMSYADDDLYDDFDFESDNLLPDVTEEQPEDYTSF